MGRLNVGIEEFTTPNPITAPDDATLDDLSQMMKANGIRHLPILRQGQVVGLVSERDLRVAKGLTSNEKRLIRANDIMVNEPMTVNIGAALDEVAFEMAQNKIGSVLVNDEAENLYGIFTVIDALNALIEIARSKDR